LTRLYDGEAHQLGSFWSECIRLGTISLNQTLHGLDARSGSCSLSAHPSDQRRGVAENLRHAHDANAGLPAAGGTTQRVPLTLAMRHTQTRYRTSCRRCKARPDELQTAQSCCAAQFARCVVDDTTSSAACGAWNHGPQLQSRGASTRLVDRSFWYVPDASIAPSELVRAALFTQRCVLCGRHFKRLLCAAVTAALRTDPRRPPGCRRLA
jgi:hypothetical protein